MNVCACVSDLFFVENSDNASANANVYGTYGSFTLFTFLDGFERAARRNPGPSGLGQASYLSSCGKELAAQFRSGESPSLKEGVLQYVAELFLERFVRNAFIELVHDVIVKLRQIFLNQ